MTEQAQLRWVEASLVAASVIFVFRRCGLEAQPHFSQTLTTGWRLTIVPRRKLQVQRVMGIENTTLETIIH